MLTVLKAGQNYHVRGGSDSYMIELASLLESRGHRVIPFAAQDPDNLESEWSDFFPRGARLKSPGPLDPFRFLYSLPAARAVGRLLDEVEIDIAHLHIYYGKLTASILLPLQSAGVPIVQTLHDYKLICPVYSLVSGGEICEACEGVHYWRALPRRCNRGSLARTALSVAESYLSRALGSWDKIDRFIAVSRFQRDKLVQHGVPAERITTVHNFVRADEITPSREEGNHFLYFGRLENGKGVHTLLDAASRLPQIPLLMAGDGSEREALERRVDEEGLDHVKLLGFKQKPEMEKLIRDSICTILPVHWYENCPMTVLESFAHGRPVVGSRMGGIPELVADGEDGFLVEPGDPTDLYEKLAWIAEHRSDAVELGAAGRRKVEAEFNADLHYTRVMQVYEEVLNCR